MTALRQLDEGLWCVTAGSFPANGYIVADGSDEGAVLVDVGLDPVAIEEALAAIGRHPRAICCTHGHFDHLGGAVHFQRRHDVPVFLHRDDLRTARSNNVLLMLLGSSERIELPELTLVDDGFAVPVGERTLRYRHAPGHTPGSCVLSLGEHLFTGDTIYARGVSLAKTAGEKPEQLRATILGMWDMLADYAIHPGHGPSARRGTVQAENRPLRAFLGIDDAEDRAAIGDGDDRG